MCANTKLHYDRKTLITIVKFSKVSFFFFLKYDSLPGITGLKKWIPIQKRLSAALHAQASSGSAGLAGVEGHTWHTCQTAPPQSHGIR